MTDKLDMISPDLISQNITKTAALFPNCVTEFANGLAIDFDNTESLEVLKLLKESYLGEIKMI